jgi:hypothetical protein
MDRASLNKKNEPESSEQSEDEYKNANYWRFDPSDK